MVCRCPHQSGTYRAKTLVSVASRNGCNQVSPMGAKMREACWLQIGTRFSFREELVNTSWKGLCDLEKETIAHKLLTTAQDLSDPRKSTEADSQGHTDWQLVVALSPLGLQTTLSQRSPKTTRKQFLTVVKLQLWNCNRDNFMIGGHHRRNCWVPALGMVQKHCSSVS